MNCWPTGSAAPKLSPSFSAIISRAPSARSIRRCTSFPCTARAPARPAPRTADWPALIEAAKSGLAGVSVHRGHRRDRHRSGTRRCRTSSGSRARTSFCSAACPSDASAGFLADIPFRGQQTGRWVIPFGRRLTGPDGKFAGIVVATLEPEPLARILPDHRCRPRRLHLGPASGKGRALPRALVARTRSANPAQDNPLLARWKDASASGFLRAPFERRGPEYLNAYRTLANPPLLVAVSLAESEILATWRLGAAVSAAIVAGFGVLLIFAWRHDHARDSRAGAGEPAHRHAGRRSSRSP